MSSDQTKPISLCRSLNIGVRANFFYGGRAIFAGKIFRKNFYALPDSAHPIIIISKKIPDFGHFISLDWMNSVFFNNKLSVAVVVVAVTVCGHHC